MRNVLIFLLLASPASAQSWRFGVAGDSRNCGDVVMPAVAAGVKANGAAFYWHLGDFRALYDFDEDMQLIKKRAIATYQRDAWPDFIKYQVAPFTVPVYLGRGNHETVGRSA